MVKKVLITGVSGFAGSFLAEYLLSLKTYSVSGTYLSDASLENISHIKNNIDLIKLDLTKKDIIGKVLKKTSPDYIFHLAALSSPAKSFKNPQEVVSNNIIAQINLLEAVKNAKLFKSRILIISSADIYGNVAPKDLPIDEDTPFAPANPYAVSKLTQDFLGFSYFLSYDMPIIRVRSFNHIGPRQSPQFVVASFAKKIADIEKGKGKNILRIGNTETRRDFTHVKDIVRGYLLAIEKGIPGQVYNLGSGVSYKISDILNILLSFSTTHIDIEKDSSLFRPADTEELLCDNRKFINLTHWKPEISIEETLKQTLDYWRNIN